MKPSTVDASKDWSCCCRGSDSSTLGFEHTKVRRRQVRFELLIVPFWSEVELKSKGSY
ncbi:hypothetical protein F2Q70_00003689 [Brassica cretica]|uniref:Uncharacterized protein n=1 Tax=Brassica cretica TaxID=69181 RepID=A0A8S9G564_BRACR|nr:hypothetical protein F2Q68_00021041 [Brassica cretica]KAF2572109.1 hypothetical protein F2Q70_00003689 [Brassica cretica]